MKKIDELQKKINKLKHKNISHKKNNSSIIMDVAYQLVAGMIVGIILGLMFDKLFDSSPLFVIICVILAMVAAFRSIWKEFIK